MRSEGLWLLALMKYAGHECSVKPRFVLFWGCSQPWALLLQLLALFPRLLSPCWAAMPRVVSGCSEILPPNVITRIRGEVHQWEVCWDEVTFACFSRHRMVLNKSLLKLEAHHLIEPTLLTTTMLWSTCLHDIPAVKFQGLL
jgi:hypothetical protein